MSEADAGSTLDFDRSVLGVDVDIGDHHVTKEEIIAYAKALGETNPLYMDEEAAGAGPYGTVIAPAGFYTFMRFKPGPNPKLRIGENRLGYMAGQNIEYFEPIRAGDTISAKAPDLPGLRQDRPHRKAGFRSDSHDLQQPAWSHGNGGGKLQRPQRNDAMSQVYFEDVEPGDQIGPRIKQPSVEETRAFAELSRLSGRFVSADGRQGGRAQSGCWSQAGRAWATSRSCSPTGWEKRGRSPSSTYRSGA